MTPPANADLLKTMRLVEYEFTHMIGTCSFLSGKFRVVISGPDEPGIAEAGTAMLSDALLESFLIHVRNLINFFLVQPRGDDVSAGHFFDDPATWWTGLAKEDGEVLLAARPRIHKKLAHLTYTRLSDTDGWNPASLVTALERLRVRFNSLGPRVSLGPPAEPPS